MIVSRWVVVVGKDETIWDETMSGNTCANVSSGMKSLKLLVPHALIVHILLSTVMIKPRKIQSSRNYIFKQT